MANPEEAMELLLSARLDLLGLAKRVEGDPSRMQTHQALTNEILFQILLELRIANAMKGPAGKDSEGL